MKIAHIELDEANDFIALMHRHHKPVQGHRFSIAALVGPKLVGVAVVGRPVARMTDQRMTLEVTRLATDGQKNACSFLYAAAARCGAELGYAAIQPSSWRQSRAQRSLRQAGHVSVNRKAETGIVQVEADAELTSRKNRK